MREREDLTVHNGEPPAHELFGAIRGEATELLDEQQTSTSRRGFEIEGVSSKDFAVGDYRLEFFVDGLLTVGQPCLIAGASKSLKTSLAIDLAVSLDSGKPFLNEFKVARTARVGVISGESGAATIQCAARRVCECKHLDLAERGIQWSFDIPRITDPTHLSAPERYISRHNLEVLILDPVYLMLLDARTAQHASNVFAMGAVLRNLSELVAELGTTLILIHHVTKGSARSSKSEGMIPDLEDMSMSGFAEFSRQWLLVGRRSRYVDGSGDHELWLRYGGSAGHGGLCGLDVREGRRDDIGGRRWSVTIRDAVECSNEQRGDAERRKIDAEERKAGRQLTGDMDRIRAKAEKFQAGDTKSQIAQAVSLPNERCGRALHALVDQGEWERCDVGKSNRKRAYEGFRPAPRDLSEHPEDSDSSDR